MSDSETSYLWQVAYRSAVLETNDVLMPGRIYEALAAIEQRRLSPIEEGGEEDRALANAQRKLQTLKAERMTNHIESQNYFPDDSPSS